MKQSEDNLKTMFKENNEKIIKDLEQMKKDNPSYPGQNEEIKKPKAPLKFPTKSLGKAGAGEGGGPSETLSKG